MFCNHCGESNPDNNHFCVGCGKELPKLNVGAVAAPQPVPQRAVPAYPGVQQTSGKAIASLVLGICGFIFPAAIAAVVLGHISRSEIKKSAGRLQGDGLAVGGLVLGYLGVAVIPILIIAAIAIPNLLRARSVANETSAVGSIRTITTAETTYATTYGGYTCNLAHLGGPGNGPNNAGLIDARLASGAKNGYKFALLGCSGTPSESFSVIAYPIAPGTTGLRYFCSDESGVVRTYRTFSGQSCAESGTSIE